MPYTDAEKRKQYAGEYYKDNRGRCLARVKACRDRLREEIFERYGRECLRCGFNADPNALQIDHIVGGGRKERKSLGPYPLSLRVRDAVNSGLYQILCANCNVIKRVEER